MKTTVALDASNRMLLFTLIILAVSNCLLAQGTAFTYQGQLQNNGSPANGSFDLQFILYDAVVGGSQTGPILTNSATAVSNGLFTVTLNFGAGRFTGDNYWLDLAVRAHGTGVFNELSPRQPLTPAPYAIFANTASNISGTIANASLPSSLTFSGTITASDFSGDGGGLTSLDASHLVSGTIPNSVLSGFQGSYSVVGGGQGNAIVSGTQWATIAGGNNNTNSGNAGTIAGGQNNTVGNGYQPTVGGGYGNFASNGYATVSGGIDNIATGYSSTVGGGGDVNVGNVASGDYSTVGGGVYNYATGNYSTVAGGGGDFSNQASAESSAVGGGAGNQASANYSTVGGGYGNTASGLYSTVGGGGGTSGGGNQAVGEGATVSGGSENQAGIDSTVGGGILNTATNLASTVSGGLANMATGEYSTVPGGQGNVAGGEYSFAAGYYAHATNTGSFVWADSQPPLFYSTANNQVSFRCAGGALFTSGSGGAGNQTVSWTPGSASWSFSSDRNLKDRIVPVSARVVLEKVQTLPLVEWSYKGYSQRHIGPMAQDFHSRFPLNDNDKMLDDADLHGIALAAIQGLNQKVEDRSKELEARSRNLEAENAELRQQNESLAARLNELEAAVKTLAESR